MARNDPFFLPVGAEAFKRDLPNATVRFFDTRHFALETHAPEIAVAIRDFLSLNDNVNRNSPDASSRRKEGDDHGQAGALHVENRDPAAFR
jgi:hypothetical protein